MYLNFKASFAKKLNKESRSLEIYDDLCAKIRAVPILSFGTVCTHVRILQGQSLSYNVNIEIFLWTYNSNINYRDNGNKL